MDANIEKPQQVCERLRMMLVSNESAAAAQRYARKWVGYDPLKQCDNMLSRIAELLGQ